MKRDTRRTADAKPSRAQVFVVKDARQIRLLGSPLRQALVDTIVSSGPCSVGTLSQMLGRPMDRLYYHLRLLEKAGLVIALNVKSGIGRRNTEFDVRGRPLRLHYDLRNAANKRAVAAAARSIWRASQVDFARGLSDPDAVVSGSGRNLWAGREQARLSGRDLAAVNQHLQEILRIMLNARDAPTTNRLLQFTFSLSPYEPARGARVAQASRQRRSGRSSSAR
jgi:predicted transcriptional regulator